MRDLEHCGYHVEDHSITFTLFTIQSIKYFDILFLRRAIVSFSNFFTFHAAETAHKTVFSDT